MAESDTAYVWVFNGGGTFPSGVFSTREKAEKWINAHGLSGVLTKYPLDEGAWDWAIREGYWTPNREDQKTPSFIQRFSCGREHYHYGEEDQSEN
ncbi:MAG TPA: hypothetical protein VIM11_13310 [Tepidisphaeraceae bacterium]|jgi:hypothetical protein